MMTKAIMQPIFLTMASPKRKFTDEQRLEILRQAKEMGITAVLRHHSLSYSVFARWREKFMRNNTNGQDSLSRNKARSELKQFMEENSRLRKIIADLALELQRKDEELRKSNLANKRDR
jgi:putative transposase